MEERLKEAAQLGSINELYVILRQSPNILESIDQTPFADTPLHVSASMGQTHFAIEILRLKPSFGEKLNPDGFSCLDLALRSDHLETARDLVRINPQLIRIQGREGFTPLHYVAGTDQVDLLAEFLVACPGSIEDLTIYGESAVHVAVRCERIAALKVLLGWLERTGKNRVLNWKDEKDHTRLHMAAVTNNPEVMRLLVKKVKKNEMDVEGSTALDIVLRHPGVVNREATEILRNERVLEASACPKAVNMAEFFISPSGFVETFLGNVYDLRQGLSSEKHNVVLVVAVLIMTTTCQALLNRPDAPHRGDDSETPMSNSAKTFANATANGDKDIWHRLDHKVAPEIAFDLFITLNSIALFLSAAVMFTYISVDHYNSLYFSS